MKDRNYPYMQTSYITESEAKTEDGIADFASKVVQWGANVPSRYGPCLEVIGGRVQVDSKSLVARKGINYSLGWMELLQLVAGVFDLDALKRVAPNADHSLFTYDMAYGPRVVDRMGALVSTLQKDPNTRQAVVFIGDKQDGYTSSLPCTLTIQFLVRNFHVYAVVSMRSWDLCRGLPYDLMMFGGLTKVVARCLGLPAGNVIVNAGSAHVYLEFADRLPSTSDLIWRFTEDAPNQWAEFVGWAKNNISYLEKGSTPIGVDVIRVP